MKKMILLAVVAVALLVAGGCAIDPSLTDAMNNTMWENSILGTGSRLYFDADGTGYVKYLLLGEESTDQDAFTYNYSTVLKGGDIIGSNSIIYGDSDPNEYRVAEDGKTLTYRGYEYELKTAPLR